MDLKDMETEDSVFGAPGYGVFIYCAISERSLPDYELLADKDR